MPGAHNFRQFDFAQTQWLFAKDIFFRLQRRVDLGSVKMMRRNDDNGVDSGMISNLAFRGSRKAETKFFSSVMSVAAIGGADSHQAQPFDLLHRRQQSSGSKTACAYYACLNRFDADSNVAHRRVDNTRR